MKSLLKVYLILVVFLLVFSFSNAIKPSSYYVGEKISLSINDDGSKNIKLKTPNETINQVIEGKEYSFIPLIEGNYFLTVKSDDGVKSYSYYVQSKDNGLNEKSDLINNSIIKKINEENSFVQEDLSLYSNFSENDDFIYINKPVRKVIQIDSNTQSKIKLHKDSFNVNVENLEGDEVGFELQKGIIQSIFNIFSSNPEVSLILSEVPDGGKITYFTPGPEKEEKAISLQKKEVKVSSLPGLHYENVLGETRINENLKIQKDDSIKIYWKEEDKYLDAILSDLNRNGYIDTINWVIPHLSEQNFVIYIEKASLLDSSKKFLSDIYDNVSRKDNMWQYVSDGQYVRVSFEKELNSKNDITLYAKSFNNQPVIVEVYEKDSDFLIAEFNQIVDEGFYKIFLNNLAGLQDTFDLRVIGQILIDLIIDPTQYAYCQNVIECGQTGPSPTCLCSEISSSDNSYADNGLGTKGGTPAFISVNLTNSTLIPSGASIIDAYLFIEYSVESGLTSCDIEYSSNSGSSWSVLDSDCTDQTTESLVSFDLGTLSETQLENIFVNITALKNPNSGATLDLNLDNIYLNVSYAVAGAISVALTYPSILAYSNSFSNLFNYTPGSSDSSYLNCTFWDNSTSTWNQNQTNSSAIINATNNSFTQTFGGDGRYIWNVQCCDSTNGCAFDFVNRTIIVDTVSPNVSLVFPFNDSSSSSLYGVDFYYNVSENIGIDNCSLIIDGEDVLTDSSITVDINQTISYPVSSGFHYWQIGCYDLAGNYDITNNRTINVTFSPQTFNARWYETFTSNFTSFGDIFLSNVRDSIVNQVSATIGTKAVETIVNATSPFMVNNGALIGSGTVSFSGLFSVSQNNQEYVTWKVYVTNTTGDTLLCQHGDDDILGTRISSASGTFTGSCTLSQSTYLSSTDRIKLVLNVFNNANGDVTTTHFWDGLSLSFVEFNTFQSLGDVTADLTYPLSSQFITTGQQMNVTCFVNCTAGECINSNVYLQQNTSTNGWTNINSSSGNLILAGDTNPHDYGNVTTTGNYTNFTIQGNVASVNNLRCIAISDYSSYNGTVTTQVTVVSANQAPQIDLLTPENNSWLNTSNVNFYYNVSDDTGVNSCSFYFDGVLNQTNQSIIINGSTNNFTINGVSDGLHNWSINCTDNVGQTNQSEIRIFYVDTVYPILQPLYPLDGQILTSSVSDFNFTVVDNLDDPLICNITIDGSVADLNFNAANSSINQRSIGSLSVGNHLWNVSCIDEAGNLNTSQTINFTVQDTAPSLVLVSPENNSWLNNSNVNFYYNVTDNNGLNSCSLYFDGVLNQTNQTIILNGSTNNFTINGVSDGLHNWYVLCNDTSELTNQSETRTFYVDTVSPQISLAQPINNSNLTYSDVNFNYTVIDNLDSSLICNVTIGGNQYVIGGSATNASLTNNLINGVNDGVHLWNVSCIDEAGNFNISSSYRINISDYPKIYLNTSDSYSFDTTSVVLNYTAHDNTEISSCSLYLDGALNQTNQSIVSSGLLNNFTINANSGNYDWYVLCNDTFGLTNFSNTRSFSVDLENPQIQLFYPSSNSTIYDSTVLFNFTSTDDLDSILECNLTVNGIVENSTNNSINGSVTNLTAQFSSGGLKVWNITCIDDAGNLNTSETRNFTLFTPPIVELLWPNQNWINNNSFSFYYNISDGNDDLKNSSLYINSVLNQSNLTALINDGTNNFSINGINDGFYNWTVTVYDYEDLLANPTELPFYVDTVAPFVNVTNPYHGEIVTTNNVTIDFSVIDSLSNNFTCNVSVDFFNEFENQQYFNGSNTEYILRNDGNYSIYAECIDLATNYNVSTVVNFSVIAPPNVTLNYPDSGFRTTSNSFVANYTPEDAVGITQCRLLVDGILNGTDNDIELNQPNFFTVENYTEGAHNWTVSCTDADGNSYAPAARSFIRDNSPPLISLALPANESLIDFNQNQILFRWTATDALDNVLLCNLTIDGTITDQNLLVTSGVPRSENVPRSEIGQGWHNWSVTCSDQVSNTNTSLTRFFNYTLPDFHINETLIYFNTTEITEDETLLITANVNNLEGADANNVEVRFYDGDPDDGGTLILSNSSVDIGAFSSTNVSAIWVADIGLSSIFVQVDFNVTLNGSFNETNETNNEANKSIAVGAWHTYYGFVSADSEFILADGDNESIVRWMLNLFDYGNLYFTDYESSISWTQLQAIGRDNVGNPSAADFSEIDTVLSMTTYNDSVYNEYTNAGTPKQTESFTIFSSDVDNVPIVNSTNVTSFVTGILWDSSDDTGNSEFDTTDQEDLVFITKLNKSQIGAYGTYDYEIKVPAKLREYDPTNSESALFYVEIK